MPKARTRTALARRYSTLTMAGLPGRVTEVSLAVPADLSEARTVKALELVGHLHESSPWWGADLLIHAEDHFGERVGQIAEALHWAPGTVANAIAVGRRFPPSQRYGRPLTMSHHAAVMRLDPEDATYWLEQSAKGENGVPWSTHRLRRELAERTGKDRDSDGTCPTCGKAGYKPS